MEKELLSNLYSATLKCMKIAQKITCVDDIKKTMVYENLISNLIFIKDTERKLSEKTKTELNFIEWDKFIKYDKTIVSNFHKTDHNTIFKIIKEDLPVLFEKLGKIDF